MAATLRPDPGPTPIGMIGLGNMGAPMARQILRKHPLAVTGRSRDRARSILAAGASWYETPRALAEAATVIILMVPDLPQVEELVFGDDGIVAAGGERTVVVSSSVSARGLRALAERAAAASGGLLSIVDAPVSGGTEGAEAGTLAIMIGGEADAVARALPALSCCGTPVHLGPLGSGDVAKACNQLIVAATMTAVAEAAVIAERSGLSLEPLLRLLQSGYAASRVLETKLDRLVSHDYAPGGAAAFMLKDLSSAAEEAESTDTATAVLDALRSTFEQLVEQGLGEQDLAVVHAQLRDSARS